MNAAVLRLFIYESFVAIYAVVKIHIPLCIMAIMRNPFLLKANYEKYNQLSHKRKHTGDFNDHSSNLAEHLGRPDRIINPDFSDSTSYFSYFQHIARPQHAPRGINPTNVLHGPLLDNVC